MAHQLEQLLTCCICLDRFSNPKLLPCQHSVCMEPCMEGLVDYVRRQVKCPECRAEHRIPYNGVQGFPTNVTLQRFLEAHIEITGETPDPHTGQYMERCNVCNEKEYLTTCAHCEKKICSGCKSAHTDILKREIGRINNQVKRAAHRLNDQLGTVDRSIVALKQNTTSVTEEIENISQRLQKAIRDRCNSLKQEVENYSNAESRSLGITKEGMEQEVSNIEANIELAEKHMDDKTPWDDNELMDTKDIFLKTMEFIRSFDIEPGDHSRRTKFQPPDDLNKIASSLSTLGELIIHHPNKNNTTYERNGPGLMKSKSDHRLASQFREQNEEFSYGSGRSSPQPQTPSGRPRRFGEPRNIESRGSEEAGDDANGRRKFRSRFMRKEEEEEKSVRFEEGEVPVKKAIRVLDTEDVARGPLSGIQRLYDCPRVIIRLQEKENGPTIKKNEPAKPQPAATPKPPATPVQKKPSRQTSNEDEIDKIKKQNQQSDSSGSAAATATSTITTSTTSSTTSKPSNVRTSSLRDDDRQSRSDRSSVSPRTSANHSPSSSVTRNESSSYTRESSATRTDHGGSSSSSSRKPSVDTGVQSTQRTFPFSRSSSTSSVGDSNKSASGMRSPRPMDTQSIERRLSRSNSTDSNKSGDGSASPKKATGAAFSTDEIKRRFSTPASSSTSTSTSRTSTTNSGSTAAAASTRYGSRFLGRAGTPSVEASKESGNEDDEEDSSEDSESEDSDESSEEEDEEEKNHYSDVGPLLGRSAQSKPSHWTDKSTANDSGYGSKYNSSDNSSGSSSSSRYGASSSSTSNDTAARKTSFDATAKKEDGFDNKYPYASKYLNRSRTDMAQPAAEEEKPSPFQSRFLNRSKSSAVIPGAGAGTDSEESTTAHGSSRQRFEELKERRQLLARSKSSAGLEEEDSSGTAGSSSYSSRYGAGAGSSSTAAASSASGAASSSGNASGDEGSNPQQLSNWARYLKNKYGNKTASTTGTTTSTTGASATSTTGASSSTTNSLGSSSRTESPSALSANRLISRSRSSHLLGLAKEGASTEDESKNVHAIPTLLLAGSQVLTQPIVGFNGNIHKSQYLQKQRLIFKIGSRGSEEGNFTWPRGIAVGPDNSIVVADSSNHRVQVFNQEGHFVRSFGSYGSADGEFDCLAGVAVNRIGQFIIADRYNHRIQIFDPSGTFLRSFGSQGSGDGRFSYPWGVTTDALGFIYVCDKENHRIQVFQSDGTFVGKFGSMGNKEGQLEHPHYIAVSSTNRVIVSDSNNHRIQVFDVNGKVSETFGSEGADEGNFKFPRGVAVDEQGYIFVADSGNNRIQVFQPDGTFVKAFGCWGQGEGEFKGLEGVAVMSNGNILVCDRENHRVQVF